MKFPFKITAKNEFDVIGFGTNTVDYLLRVAEYPAFNSKTKLTDYMETAGGEIASTMVGLERLGMHTAYVGRFGSDPAGKLGMNSLMNEGVDTGFAEIIGNAKTQISFIIIDERNGERTILWQRDEKLHYPHQNAPIDTAHRGRVLHLTPHDTLACVLMATAAKQAGVLVSLDIDNVFDGIADLLPLVDICIASADFPAKLFGIRDAKTGLSEIASRFGCAVAGLTQGAAGSIFTCQGKFFENSRFNVPGGCIDTTGAGDAFRAGFLYGMLNGRSLEESSITANAVAALNCRGLGARSGLPTLDELDSFLK